ncbi:rod shape-determining protein RodA [Salmonella enterica subsp. diarizonae]|nr:rod shape-determining protein RodA [Salmonella enterica subsp. diarizonae]
MTDNPNKKTFWDKIHIDPTMLLILLALLVYSALVIWSASGQDIGMMERKIGQIAMGLVVMVVMAQIPPRVYEGWAPYLYIICIILLVAVDAFGAISKGAPALARSRNRSLSAFGNSQNRRAADGRPLY